jgi:hypothetical protein
VKHKVTNYVFCLAEHGVERRWLSILTSRVFIAGKLYDDPADECNIKLCN